LDVDTFQRLQKVRDKFGPRRFGKITQKLLALALHESGFEHVVEREVQGVDIDAAARDGRKYALEVKTTEGENIPISQENLDALKDRTKDGYTPVVALLRMQMFEDWIFAGIPLGSLGAGSVPRTRLLSYRIKELETLVCASFEHVVDEHCSDVLSRGERYLNEVLDQKRIERVSE
jgi:Holliday junction resolvase